jgi:hypothetical protein
MAIEGADDAVMKCDRMGGRVKDGRFLRLFMAFADNLRPLALDLGSSLIFALFVASALYFRRRGGIHKTTLRS